MRISKLRLTCKCGHVFDAEIVVDAPMDVALASMKAARCPKCRNRKGLMMGGTKATPPLQTSIKARAKWWTENGDRGVSSETIYSAFMDMPYDGPDVPHDPEDFGRCRKLFELFPEWRANLEHLVEIIPWYKPFVERWDEMDRLWNEEAPTASCPKLYELMKIAEQESEIILRRMEKKRQAK